MGREGYRARSSLPLLRCARRLISRPNEVVGAKLGAVVLVCRCLRGSAIEECSQRSRASNLRRDRSLSGLFG